MKKNIIKLLAEHTFENGVINNEVATYALTKLSQQELKTYFFYIKQLLKKNTVYITISDEVDKTIHKRFESLYPGKKIEYIVNPNIGGGIVIKNNDDILDATIQGILHQTVEKLKEVV